MGLWRQGAQYKNPSCIQAQKPLVDLCYFNTFETCNSLILLQMRVLLSYSADNVMRMSTSKEHVER